jgi:hypothetical protein
MRRIALPLALVLGLVFSGSASAQFVFAPGGGGMGLGRQPKFPLFMDPAVRKDLKLSKEQETKISEILEEFQQGGINFGGGGEGRITIRIGGAGPGGAPGPIQMPDFKKIEQDLMNVLEDKQKTRIKQIWLQRSGVMALGDKEVAKEVGLEDAQSDLIKDILDNFQQQTQKAVQDAIAEAGGPGGPVQFDAKKMKALRDEAEKSIKDVLSPEQDAKWQELLGPKLEVKKTG